MSPFCRLPILASSLTVLIAANMVLADTSADAAFYAPLQKKGASVAAIGAVGRQLFFDPSLSASGKQSCASCHSPEHAYGPSDGKAVQLGGAGGLLQGTRAVPSIRYVQNVPSFTEHFYEGEGRGDDQGPTGGHTWDGRARTIHEQARLPLLSPVEMANRSPAEVVAKVRSARYADALRAAFGPEVVRDDAKAFDAVLLALEVFQQTPAEFYPYSSKYDAYLRGKATLSKPEARGLALFESPDKGNCAVCHPSAMKEGASPQFTDWGYIALGVPRNKTLSVNRDPRYFDLGLCGPARQDFAGNPAYCGLFRTPSLRNVAERKVFFHNGTMHKLDEVVAFYATRDTDPARWYGRNAAGKPRRYNDLPQQYHDNVNQEAPFGRKAGASPALTQAEIHDVVAFLKTLSDGYQPTASSK
jgi:cytochrome c peroxidase